ncbi:hypothetical protein SMD11_1209 [Streptomyces albireticuli]|uniref:Uncharacterized protein n=1 Tax=Streptomyces albireticuli TaxID=1940 RepID=A0A1Z2KXX5_9ACTN|nr:hypothetical protein [Streptomyces albireticuli]ARZ66870.1 hypothetical protein SMD11_1209 [Streptomyces albireticuli]
MHHLISIITGSCERCGADILSPEPGQRFCGGSYCLTPGGAHPY